MNAKERREASRAFSDQLRAQWAERRRRLTEDLWERAGAKKQTAPRGQSEPRPEDNG